jgi:hypothetical protein
MKYVYKVVCVLLAAIVVGVVLFAPIVGIRVHSEIAALIEGNAIQNGDEEMIEKYIKNDGVLSDHISEKSSIYDMVFGEEGTFFKNVAIYFDIANNEEIRILYAPVIAFAAALAVVVLCALAVVVFGLFAKNNRKVIYSCIAGIGSSLLVKECFGVIEETFVSGRLTLGDITQESWMDILGNIVNFEVLDIFNAAPIVFGVIIVWTFLYNYTLTPEQKRERKLLLGEAD